MKIKNTKGKLSKAIAFSTSGSVSTFPKATPLTPFDIFQHSLDRAQNLLRIHKEAHGEVSRPPAFLADAHRAAIVLAVSALDAFIRTLVVEKIVAKIADQSQTVPQELKQQAQELLGKDGLFDAARANDLGSRLEKAFRLKFEGKSFQGIKNIEDALYLIGHDKVFSKVAKSARVNEENLKSELAQFTKKRHIVAHCGDYDLTQTPPIENKILKKNVKDCIKLVKLVATEINKLR
jgi:acyl carrier protein